MSEDGDSPPPPLPPRRRSSGGNPAAGSLQNPVALSREEIENEGDSDCSTLTEVLNEAEPIDQSFHTPSFNFGTLPATPSTSRASIQSQESPASFVGRTTRNWIMASVWDPKVTSSMEQSLRISGRSGSIRYTRKSLVEIINGFLDAMNAEEAKLSLEQDLFVVIVTPQNFDNDYHSLFHNFELEVIEMDMLAPSLFPGSALRSRSSRKERVNSMFASGGLAEILRAVVNAGDIFIVTGGYQLYPETRDRLECILNQNANDPIIIIRIPTNPDPINHDLSEVSMVEVIEPHDHREGMFKFSYSAVRDGTKRYIVQNRNFSGASFCRKVTDTLAFSYPRWDFPVPIVRGMDPKPVFDLLFSPKFKMPTSPSPYYIPESPDTTDSDSELDESYTTVSAVSTPSVRFSSPEKLEVRPKKRVTYFLETPSPPPTPSASPSPNKAANKSNSFPSTPSSSKQRFDFDFDSTPAKMRRGNENSGIRNHRHQRDKSPFGTHFPFESDSDNSDSDVTIYQCIIIFTLVVVGITCAYYMWLGYQDTEARIAVKSEQKLGTLTKRHGIPGPNGSIPPQSDTQIAITTQQKETQDRNVSRSWFSLFVPRGGGGGGGLKREEEEVEEITAVEKVNGDQISLIIEVSHWMQTASRVVLELFWCFTTILYKYLSVENILNKLGVINTNDYHYFNVG